MSQNYTAKMKTGSQSLPVTATRLNGPGGGEIVTVLVASTLAFKYASEENGFYRTAGLNPETAMYEKLFPVANAFDQIWFKSASGTITVEWDALLNHKA